MVMKNSLVNTSVVILALLSTSALAETTLNSSKSNSFRAVQPCTTPACCIQHPGAPGCQGSQLKSQVDLPRHPRDTGPQPPAASTATSGHATEKTVRSKSNITNNREADVSTSTVVPTPTPAATEKGKGKMPGYERTQPTPTPAASEKIKAGYDLKKNIKE